VRRLHRPYDLTAGRFTELDRELMLLALGEAERAAGHGDVPIGAVLARNDEILAQAGNQRELRQDPTAHAEILVLRQGASVMGGWRLPLTTLYVTLEPCAMCAGAIVLARVPRVVYATAESVLDVLDEPAFNHRPEVDGGLLADEAAEQLRAFFEIRR
jgi:tRNA(adenine34) deaminase